LYLIYFSFTDGTIRAPFDHVRASERASERSIDRSIDRLYRERTIRLAVGNRPIDLGRLCRILIAIAVFVSDNRHRRLEERHVAASRDAIRD
jgi:hypothetical protein